MRTRITTVLGGTVAVVAVLAAVQACDRDPKGPNVGAQGSRGAAGGTPAAFISTRFEDCATAGTLANPAPRDANPQRFSTTLHGVWVGGRTVRDGKSLNPQLVQGEEPDAHYVVIYDMNAREGFAFELRGPQIRKNAFTELLPPAPASAPKLIYYYCGTRPFAPFRDEFVKVSNNPADGLRALGQVTGTTLDASSVFKAWGQLRDAGYFTRDHGTAHVNSAFYTISVLPLQSQGGGARKLRWDMVSQLRGSPAKFPNGQPVPGLEGGAFETVAAGPSTGGVSATVNPGEVEEPEYMVSSLAMVTCNCDLTPVDASQAPMTNMTYTKIVLGPLQ
jgi:hypothetical protein